MNSEAAIENRRELRGAWAFPEKANPNRPVLGRMREPLPSRGERVPGDASAYPQKCNPRARRTPLTDDQRRLVVRYLPLARAMARKVKFPNLEREELRSAAYLALVEAAQSFDPSLNVNFATFARYRIRGALSNCRESWFRLAIHGDGLPSPVFRRLGFRDDVQAWALGQREVPQEGAEFERTEALDAYFRGLPRKQASACRLIYIDGKSQDEAAALLGYSKAYLSRLHQNALELLRSQHEVGRAGGEPASGASKN